MIVTNSLTCDIVGTKLSLLSEAKLQEKGDEKMTKEERKKRVDGKER